jgi:hypothetical protein
LYYVTFLHDKTKIEEHDNVSDYRYVKIQLGGGAPGELARYKGTQAVVTEHHGIHLFFQAKFNFFSLELVLY